MKNYKAIVWAWDWNSGKVLHTSCSFANSLENIKEAANMVWRELSNHKIKMKIQIDLKQDRTVIKRIDNWRN